MRLNSWKNQQNKMSQTVTLSALTALFLTILPLNLQAQQTLSPPAAPSGSALPPPTQSARGNNALPSGGFSSTQQAQQAQPQIIRKSQEQIRQEAFNAAILGLFPMEQDEIRKMLEHFDETRQAAEIPVQPYPEPEIVVETISLDPGAKPPVIKVATGHVSTLTIMDLTSSPWPIQDMSWAGNFEIIRPEQGGNILRITPMSEFAYGNISMRLVGLNTPVTFTVKTARDSIHYRFDARIPDYGPNAATPIINQSPSQAEIAGATDEMNAASGNILEGVPPADAKRLIVSGVDGRTAAYIYNDKTYVRTPLKLLSPSWMNSMSSADGMNVYVLKNAPVLLLSDKGQVVRAHLNKRENVE